MAEKEHVIVGTAGHIDHGKSALVRALTGTDPDTLPEEKARGMTIIFISHRLEEVFEVTDRISVLRDGKYLGTFEAGQTTPREIISLIAGRELSKEFGSPARQRDCACPEVALEVRGLAEKSMVAPANWPPPRGARPVMMMRIPFCRDSAAFSAASRQSVPRRKAVSSCQFPLRSW